MNIEGSIPQEAYHEMLDYEIMQTEKWDKAKKYLENLIHPKYIDLAEDNETYFSERIVKIELTNRKLDDHPNRQCCKIKHDNSYYLYSYLERNLETVDQNSKYEGEPIKYWIWQQTGIMRDDFSGFILLPLLDGERYWQVSYSC